MRLMSAHKNLAENRSGFAPGADGPGNHMGPALPSVVPGPNVLPGIEFEGQRFACKARCLGVG